MFRAFYFFVNYPIIGVYEDKHFFMKIRMWHLLLYLQFWWALN